MMYAYTRTDLLQGEPQHYMYAAFEGPDFLEAYVRDRQAVIERLRLGLMTLEGDELAAQLLAWRLGRRPVAGAGAPRRLPQPGQWPVRTVEALRPAVRAVLAGADPAAGAIGAWTDALLRKFEIAKRLRSGYGRGLRALAMDTAEPEAYALLAFLIAAGDRGAVGLRRLNALLKLDDLLASADLKAAPPRARMAALLAMERELALVRALAADKGVPLPPPAETPEVWRDAG